MRKHSFVAKAGLILPLLVLCGCAFGFLLAPNDPDLVDLTKKFLSPCSEFPLGTDNLGRCVLSRLLYGGRTTLGIVLVGSVTVSVLGTLAGLLMGGGKNGKNLILEGVLNAVTAIPPIAYLIIFIAAWGNSVFTMVVAVSASLMLRVTSTTSAFSLVTCSPLSTGWVMRTISVFPLVCRAMVGRATKAMTAANTRDKIPKINRLLSFISTFSCHKNSSASVATEQPQARKGKNGMAMGWRRRESLRNRRTIGMAKTAATKKTRAIPEGP